MGAPNRTWLGGFYNLTENTINWVSGADVTFNRFNMHDGGINNDKLNIHYDESNPGESVWGRKIKSTRHRFICE